MKDVEIKLHAAQFASLKRMLRGAEKQIPMVMAGAINVTARAARERAIDEMRGQVNLKKGYLRTLLKIIKATRHRWVATIRISGRRPGLIHFGARPTARGISYKIRVGARKRVAHAFIQTVKGAENVWIRAKKGESDSGMVSRLPIVRLTGPSLGQVVTDAPQILERVQQEAAVNLEKNIDSKVRWILEKRAAG